MELREGPTVATARSKTIGLRDSHGSEITENVNLIIRQAITQCRSSRSNLLAFFTRISRTPVHTQESPGWLSCTSAWRIFPCHPHTHGRM